MHSCVLCQATSAKEACDIARAAVKDGSSNASHRELVSPSAKNSARHLDKCVAKNVASQVAPYNVELPVKKAGRRLVSGRVVPVVLPHELIFDLYHETPERFNEVFFGNQGDGQERLD